MTFDRRELLLHLGDMLEALSCLTKAGRPDAPVVRLAKEHDSLQEFGYLQALTPKMTVAEFSGRVASAFPLVAKGTARVRAQPQCVASTVQHDLFDGSPDGWKEYVVHVRKEREVVWDRASHNDTGRLRRAGARCRRGTHDARTNAALVATETNLFHACDDRMSLTLNLRIARQRPRQFNP
jgi:hypothetical protein